MLGQIGAVWCNLVQIRPWLVQTGAVWCKLVQIEAVWCSLGHSTLVRLVRLYSMYDSILFSLSRLVRLVQPCSMNVSMFFGLSTLVRLVQPALCMLVFYSVLVRCYP